MRFRASPPCPVHHNRPRFLASAVGEVGRSPFTRWADPASSAGSCEWPVAIGSTGLRTVASCLSNVPEPTTWVPSAFTRVRSLASEV